MLFYNIEIEEVFKITGTSHEGLSAETAAAKLSESGPNELEEKKKRSPFWLFINQFKDFMILVLVAAAIIAGFAGDVTDTIIILIIVLLNAVIGFVQEYRAEKAIEALKKLGATKAGIIRGNKPLDVPSAQLVTGDVVLLEAGNVVPADLRLIETHTLLIDESALTGESVPAEKNVAVIAEKDPPLGDRFNMVYKSTMVVNGRAKGIVVATGMNTEIGAIAKLLQQKESVTPLQKRMTDFGKKISYIILLICIILFGTGLLRGEKPLEILLLSISLAVAAIPEALPALISIALAQGSKRLVRINALVRKLSAVETLGSVNFICSDKTGTLTQNIMKVVQVNAAADDVPVYENFSALNCALALNNDVKKDTANKLTGDPTEIALVNYFIEQHSLTELDKLQKQLPREAELPFDSDRKCMTTVHCLNESFLVVCKGAVESVAANLIKANDAEVLTNANKLAADGMRVLAFAYKMINKLPEPFTYELIEKDLIFAGLVAMIDPPREEAKLAIDECKTAGIKVVMITGDHPATASAIARQLGILSEKDLVLTGAELQTLSKEEFSDKVEHISVYARVSPQQKLDIIKALQLKDNFVSMTGDGVNDAPSLKAANIGIAMGINGTDVSKEAAHMILLDDNFATIVKAVKEGRRIYDNIRKFVKYIMTCNGAEILIIALAPFIGLPNPLLPIQILWINLVTDGLPGLALAGEKAETGIMQRPPRKANESLLSAGIGSHIVWVGLLMAGVTLGVQAWAIDNKDAHWQTMVFTVLSLTQLGHVLAIRSESESLYRQGLFSNKPLLGVVIITVLLQVGVIYLPFANTLFKTQPLSLSEMAVCVGASAIVFHAVEFEKWIKRKKKN